MSDKKMWDEFIKVAKERDTLQAENARLTAERDRALDRIAAMAAELDTPYAWHHLHHGLRYERGEGEGWWPLYGAPVPPRVPERLTADGWFGPHHHYASGWNDAIDAMLEAAPKPEDV